MMKFTKWLENRVDEAAPANPFRTGTTKSRPGAGAVANRSQLWGPSATFGRPDSMMPWEKPHNAAITSFGSAFQKELGYQPTPITSIEPPPESEKGLFRWAVLPLQLPEGRDFQSKNTLGMFNLIKDLLGEGPQALKNKKIRNGAAQTKDGQIEIGSKENEEESGEPTAKFRTPDFGDEMDMHNAVEFTQSLMHYIHVVNMNAEGILHNYDWQDPAEIIPNIKGELLEAIFKFDLAADAGWDGAKEIRGNNQERQSTQQMRQDLAGIQNQQAQPQQ